MKLENLSKNALKKDCERNTMLKNAFLKSIENDIITLKMGVRYHGNTEHERTIAKDIRYTSR